MIKALESKFKLQMPCEISLSKAEETIRTKEGCHTIYIQTIGEQSLVETIARAKLNERCNADVFNIEVYGSAKDIQVFNWLSVHLLMVWVYDTMSIFLDSDELKREIGYLYQLYEAFCNESDSDSATMAAYAFAILKIHHFVDSEDNICDLHKNLQPIVDTVLHFSNSEPSMKVLCDYVNVFDAPFKAHAKEGGVISLVAA